MQVGLTGYLLFSFCVFEATLAHICSFVFVHFVCGNGSSQSSSVLAQLGH